ncbi:hypothetical protein [Nocardia sp. SSK8]|uniref:hypothetical protein n=1 Tax=Nocardia sp. SSK8 TaxID=3120154 RepID=UPI00300B6118
MSHPGPVLPDDAQFADAQFAQVAPTPPTGGQWADPFTHPAPALPLPPRPDTVFTAVPDTSARLAHRGALRVALRPSALIPLLAAMLILLPMSVLLGLWWQAAGAVVIGVGGPTLAYTVTRRRLRRSFDVICAPGATMAVQLGPDALDIGDVHSYVRVAYGRISAIRTAGAIVVLHVDNHLRLNFPRELFPAPLAEQLRHLIWHRDNPQPGAPAPLPELPTLLHPQATLVADDATARTLFGAEIREPLLRQGVLIRFGVGAVVMTGVIGWFLGPLWMILPIGMFALMAYATVRAIRHPGPEATRIIRHATPGAVLATQFGADALVYQTRTHLLRIRYPDIRAITLRPDTAVITHLSGRTVLPRPLLPDEVATRLRTLGLPLDPGNHSG